MIELSGVTKRFGQYTAVEDVSINVARGVVFGLLGSNGAGKSTLLRLISGIYMQSEGMVKMDGQPVYDNETVKENILFISDETAQWNSYTLTDMRDFYALFYPKFSKDKFLRLQNMLNLPTNRRLRDFSKGMKRQAAMICALACNPRYLLIDEALDGLDASMRFTVKKMISEQMMDSEMTAVVSSHNLREIDEFCDRAALLHQGKLIFDRDLDALKNDVFKIQAVFEQDVTREDLASVENMKLLHYYKQGSVCYLVVKGEEGEIKKRIGRFTPKFAEVIPLSLEEIFIYEMEALGYDYDGGINGINQ
jgi:ABC-2 type transport system ATP-binding protein